MITKRVKNNALINLNTSELKQAMKVALITALSTIAIKSFAVNCDDHKSCFGKSVSLIKQAVKLGKKDNKNYCIPEVKALAQEVSNKASPGSARYEALETCLTIAKGESKRLKGKAKEQERLSKALKADS